MRNSLTTAMMMLYANKPYPSGPFDIHEKVFPDMDKHDGLLGCVNCGAVKPTGKAYCSAECCKDHRRRKRENKGD